MSEAPAPATRIRVNPRAAAGRRRRGTSSPWPWNDPTGRFSTLKASAVFAAAAPAVWLAYAWAMDLLGPRPVTEAIHGTGQLAVRFLLLSLLVSPARAIFNWRRVMIVRRQLGMTALLFTLAHLVLYADDQGWNLAHVASEILARFYLMVGLVALVGLAVLGVTSTERSQRVLGQAWKRLHRIVFPIAVLASFHFFLQAKVEVGEATLMAGLYLWAIGWRLLPAGPDRAPLPILGLSLAAAAATLGLEYAWFALGTNVDPMRVLRGEADIAFGPHAAVQVLILGLCLAIATALSWALQRERLRTALPFAMALYAGGAAIVVGVSFCFSLTDGWLPDAWDFTPAAAAFIGIFAMLGAARWVLTGWRRTMDAAAAALLLLPLATGLVTG